MSTKERFANNLKNLRKSLGFTQEQMADILMVTRTTYSGYEHARAEPALDFLPRCSKVFRISIDSMLKREILCEANGTILVSRKDHTCE